MQIEQNNTQDQNERHFVDYLSRISSTDYSQFTLDIDDYRKQNSQGAQQIIKDPTKYYRLIKKYLQEHKKQNQLNKNKVDSKIQHFNIKIEGNLGANFVTPRGLNSRMANQLVGLQGIITKIDLPKKYLQKSVHYCQKTKAFQMREYPDAFNPEKDVQLNLKRTIKSYDQNNNPLSFQYGFSSFKNMQMAVIQELPEMAPPGLLPMSVQVVLQNKLVDSVKPGDRVQMIGIYKLISSQGTKQKGIFRPYFLCLNIRPLNQTASYLKRPSKIDFPKDQIFNLFSRSIAPSLWGHQHLKKAVLLMLVGGVQKITPNNTHLRGDINILMVGDPGTAKSQMLRWVLSSVDVSIGTTGSGASGVGLTAAIVSDPQTGQKTLQAGAMVLADRGVVCIDQFDKMNEIDRVAVHEVMEQQTVTIAKAGLHCSLNARCAVIAAANPIYGQYQSNLLPTKNIGMPDSLLSRFDLVFVILDQKNPQKDRQIASKVCKNHRLAPVSNQFFNQYIDSNEFVVNPISQRKQDQGIYEKNNVYKSQEKTQLVTQTFLKRYINWVKNTFQPKMSDNAVKLCAQIWTKLRQRDINQRQTSQTKVLPITIRSLESLIRLSTAHAKLRQSQDVQTDDVVQGFKLMVYCIQSDQYALDYELKQIINKLDLDYQFQPKYSKKTQKNNNKNEQKEQQIKKKQPQQNHLRERMQKMNLQRGKKEIDELLDNHIMKEDNYISKQNKEQIIKKFKPLVYRKITEIKKTIRNPAQGIPVKQVFQKVQGQKYQIQMALKMLQEEDYKITIENGIIHLV